MSDPDVAIWGGGYVGLTGAVHWARAGRQVVIVDPDPVVVEAISAGRPKAGEFLSYLGVAFDGEGIRATTEPGAAYLAPVQVVAVPTEKQGLPSAAIVREVLQQLGLCVMDGTVILVESTLEPGTLDGFLEWLQAQGLRDEVGRTWFLACCPRRDWFADPEKNLETLPRIVGGVTAACTERALTILSAVSRTLLPTTYRTAEVTKALENALLHVPVMLAHELALGLPELDVAEALQLAGTHWRLTPLYLGFGTGGRCVPLGSEYLNNALHARGSGRQLVQEALRLDQRMRRAIAEAAAHWCPPPATALVLGIGYRPEFADVGRSPGRDVARELLHRGFGVSVHDPLLSESQLARLTGIPVWPGGELKQYDVILLATPHKAYAELPACAGFRPGQVVIDGQGAWRGYADGLKELAVHYVQVGTPGWRGPARTEPRRA